MYSLSFLTASLLLWSPISVLGTTNGISNGTSGSPTYPKFLPTDDTVNGLPRGWDSPAGPAPNTGVTRTYDFSIARSTASPDGYTKNVIVVNDQYPGPTVEANWGDMISVTVTNNIGDVEEGTTVHWHGMSQQLTPWADGVPGISQCPIPPGESYTYTFQANDYGTSWWHSHASAQYIDGIFGAMVIYGPTESDYDIDLGPVVLNDYFHQPYYEIISAVYHKPPEFLPGANTLINGRMPYDCSLDAGASSTGCDSNAPYSTFNLQPGKIHRLRLVNTGGAGTQKFSIDGHEMTIIANDFVPIQPYKTNVVTLGSGQRSDVLVTGKQEPDGAYWMRSDLDYDCLNETWSQIHGMATVYYPEANTAELPTTTAYTWESNNCRNDPLESTVPLYPLTPSEPATTQQIDITAALNDSGNLVFMMNGQSTQINYNAPPLLLAASGNSSYPNDPKWNIYNFGSATSIRIVMRNLFPTVHPIHLHGHNPWILAEGLGDWDGNITNPSNPQRRDVHLLQPGTPDMPSYVVLQWNADNPGVWPLHCHIVIHVSAGLVVNVMERPDLIQSQRKIPADATQLCETWGEFTDTNIVDQIDSGLKIRS